MSLNTSVGFSMVIDLGIDKKFIVSVIDKLEICEVRDVFLTPGRNCQKATVVVDRWFNTRKSKDIYDGLLLGTPFMIYNGIEKYSRWMACVEKMPKYVMIDESRQFQRHSER